MAKFCGKCGSKLDDNGFCPNCNLTTENLGCLSNDTKNTDIQTLSKKEIKARKKADEVAAKVKIKGIKKTDRITEKANKRVEKKSQKSADKIRNKTQIKVQRISEKYDEKAKRKSSKVLDKKLQKTSKKVRCFAIKFIAIILVIAVLFSTSIGLLVYFDVVEAPFVSNILGNLGIKNSSAQKVTVYEYLNYGVEKNEQNESDTVSAESYYGNCSETLEEIELNNSENILTEEEAYNTFKNYGFGDCIIFSEYSEDGEYTDMTDISPFSVTKHPSYMTSYIDDEGNIWDMYLINGVFMINPVTLNSKSKNEPTMIISSSESLMSYDNKTKKFYQTLPKKSVFTVKTMTKIGGDDLKKLTAEEVS